MQNIKAAVSHAGSPGGTTQWVEAVERHVLNAGSHNHKVSEFPSGSVIYLLDLAYNRAVNFGLDAAWKTYVTVGRAVRDNDISNLDPTELERIVPSGEGIAQRAAEHFMSEAERLGYDWRTEQPADIATAIIEQQRGHKIAKLLEGELPRQVWAARAGVSDRLMRQFAQQMFEAECLRNGAPIPGSYRTRRSLHARLDREAPAYKQALEDWFNTAAGDGMTNGDLVQRAVEVRLHAA